MASEFTKNSDPRCDASYQAMREHNVALLIHTGHEHSISAGGVVQDFGNPLLLRRALDAGVKVIAAHCASEGSNHDLDHPGQHVRSWELLKRLLQTPQYENLLFADISMLIGFKRLDTLEDVLFSLSWLRPRLVHGSDYPVPALNLAVHTSKCVSRGLLTPEEKMVADEIYHVNPLLFDYVVKRLVACPRTKSTFPPTIFHEHPALRL